MIADATKSALEREQKLLSVTVQFYLCHAGTDNDLQQLIRV